MPEGMDRDAIYNKVKWTSHFQLHYAIDWLDNFEKKYLFAIFTINFELSRESASGKSEKAPSIRYNALAI